jgi:DNA-directed RNA polymerase specialized sigma24 family protein
MGDLLFPFGRNRRGGAENDTGLDRLRDTDATDRFSHTDPERLIEVPVDWLDEALAETPDLAPEADVHGAAVRNIEAARVRRLLPALPAREHLVLALHFGVGCQEQTWPQIAERLGVCEKTAHSLKKRGIDRLRAAWLEQESPAAAVEPPREAPPREAA